MKLSRVEYPILNLVCLLNAQNAQKPLRRTKLSEKCTLLYYISKLVDNVNISMDCVHDISENVLGMKKNCA